MRLPEGYAEISSAGSRAFAWGPARTWAEAALGEAGSFRGWAGSRADTRSLAGRGIVLSVPAPATGPDRRARWAVRPYLRGGAVARILYDLYLTLGASRPERELRASVAARSRGIRTPAVVAGCVYPAGAFYRADLVTELVPDARDLAGVVFDGAGPEARDALEAAGGLVAAVARAGLVHPDLNAKNIVLQDTDGAFVPHLLDLDRAEALPAGRAGPADAMLRRLQRSLRKLSSHRRPLTDEEWSALVKGFAAGARQEGNGQ